VNPKAVEAMRERGYDLSRHKSKSLAELATQDFDLAITMDCGDECPFIRAVSRQDWNIPDPRDLPPERFREVRDMIEQKVKALLHTL
jgi:protein-tyrosine-phosphatase